jgi:hypothetical protein
MISIIIFTSSSSNPGYIGKHKIFFATAVDTGRLEGFAEDKPLYMGISLIKG